MLPQFGFTEFFLLVIVALIVLGPKDLALFMRQLGQFVARGRSMANEFRAAFDDIARETELDELRKEIQDLRRDNMLSQAVEDLKSVEQDINRQVLRQDAEHKDTAPKDTERQAPPSSPGASASQVTSPETRPGPKTGSEPV